MTVSDGPSKPMVCVPGIDPARVDATSMRAGSRRSTIARLSISAVPDGASFLAAWCSSWIQAPKSCVRREAAGRLLGEQLEQVHAEREVRRRHARRCRRGATSARSAASCASQPVVPITTLMPRAASCGRFDRHGLGQREVDGDVDAAVVAREAVGVELGDDAGDLEAVAGRQALDEPAHPAVADQEQPVHADRPSPAGAKKWSCSRPSACGDVGFAESRR